MQRAYILSADGAWRWSPPGRVLVVWDGSSHDELLRAAKRATRLPGDSWQLSLDGATPLAAGATLMDRCGVHMIDKAHRRTVHMCQTA